MGPELGTKKKGLKTGTGLHVDLKPRRLKTKMIENFNNFELTILK